MKTHTSSHVHVSFVGITIVLIFYAFVALTSFANETELLRNKSNYNVNNSQENNDIIRPVSGIKPSGTIPILYINTENNTEINQKTTYINATYWLDASMTDDGLSIGSETEPLTLGIRGRGNASWLHNGQKPYKIKLDKKQRMLGMSKSKHFALLSKVRYTQLYNQPLGSEISRKMGMLFTPQSKPIDLVLNGQYYGLYYLTETVRVESERVNITEQPEYSEDPADIESGWLVEIDNYTEVNQVKIPQPSNRLLPITHHSPENVSNAQRDWLVNEFTDMMNAIYTNDKLDTTWTQIIDPSSLADFTILQEAINNFDAFVGSCYLCKDKDMRWTFGIPWDFDYGYGQWKTELIIEQERQQPFIRELYKFPSFRKALRDSWQKIKNINIEQWYANFIIDLQNEIRDAVKTTNAAWPYMQIPYDVMPWFGLCVMDNLRYLESRYKDDLELNTLDCTIELKHDNEISAKENDDNNDIDNNECKFYINGHDINNVEITPEMDVVLTLEIPDVYTLRNFQVLGDATIEDIGNTRLKLSNMRSNISVKAICDPKANDATDIFSKQNNPVINVNGSCISVSGTDNSLGFFVYNALGHLISKECFSDINVPSPGIYFVKYKDKFTKVLVR